MGLKVKEMAHRTGRPQRMTGKPRHIIFRVATLEEKVMIMKKQRATLEKESYYLADDMTKADMKMKRQLQPAIQKARDEDKRFRFTIGRLYIEGKLHNPKYDNLNKDPAAKKTQAHMDKVAGDSRSRLQKSRPQKAQLHAQTPNGRSAQGNHVSPLQQVSHSTQRTSPSRQRTSPPRQRQHTDYQQHRSSPQSEQQPPLPHLSNPPPGVNESHANLEHQHVTGEVTTQNG